MSKTLASGSLYSAPLSRMALGAQCAVTKEETKIPLSLWNKPHWELLGDLDSLQFFQQLSSGFPEATTFFIEGTSIANDVEQFFRSMNEVGKYLPDVQTIWPTPKQFRLPASKAVLEGLHRLADSHAEPELFDHFFAYAGSSPLIEYPDAFSSDSPIFVSHQADETRVRNFARDLGLELKNVQAV